MPTIDQRVTALEDRSGQLAEQTRHTADVAETAAREAVAARDAHLHNVTLLNALRRTQMDQGRVLARHEQRMNSIDTKLGTLMLGMHTIESLLRDLVEREAPPPGSR